MADLSERLDKMEETIKKPSFRQSSGRANEVNYWVFDYPPEHELEVRERIKYMQNRNFKGGEEFELVVFDLYDIIIDFLKENDFMEECYKFEKKKGLERITKAVSNSMKINDDDSLIVQHIKDNTPDNAVVFLTGVGKCFPILRSHKVLNNLHQAFVKAPVVMFFPGVYNEQELILFGEIKDDNYYRAFKLVK
ncbi:DUF1788 domain-containing protein [Agathobacter ruminis]|uniref:DUF1788 domain-containing protein n=1 Tax=Agathobacter ruminis TaxID=1712665 RepID=A0A2G3E6P6_9FIRM|nr:DUF1788 domain-containing protein [Agathobacter ruminis]MDC7301011.1 DUF1788 domain-containing protein [Agathobacter ruminis]PHU38959.1 hypothetical protein CSX02_00500 [Agathobacter ruminis]